MAFLLAKPTPHNVNHDHDRFSMFNKKRDIPRRLHLGQLGLKLRQRVVAAGVLPSPLSLDRFV